MNGLRYPLVAIFLSTCSAATWGHAGPEHEESGAAAGQTIRTAASKPKLSSDEASRNYFTDLPLVNQDGESVRFYSDVLKGRVVMINFIYTNCADACPLLTYKLTQVKNVLGERFGRDVFFVSISIDPERDTPGALRAYAAKQKAEDPGWVFLTGSKSNIDTIVKKLGQYTPEVEAHSTLLLAGNVKTRHWAKVPPMATVEEMALRVQILVSEL